MVFKVPRGDMGYLNYIGDKISSIEGRPISPLAFLSFKIFVDIQIPCVTLKNSTPNDLLGQIERPKKKNEDVITLSKNLLTMLSLLEENLKFKIHY
jgi:hypothetical protein